LRWSIDNRFSYLGRDKIVESLSDNKPKRWATIRACLNFIGIFLYVAPKGLNPFRIYFSTNILLLRSLLDFFPISNNKIIVPLIVAKA
jgi:hypothetical protein